MGVSLPPARVGSGKTNSCQTWGKLPWRAGLCQGEQRAETFHSGGSASWWRERQASPGGAPAGRARAPAPPLPATLRLGLEFYLPVSPTRGLLPSPAIGRWLQRWPLLPAAVASAPRELWFFTSASPAPEEGKGWLRDLDSLMGLRRVVSSQFFRSRGRKGQLPRSFPVRLQTWPLPALVSQTCLPSVSPRKQALCPWA